jgi:hypothetical protein
MLARLILLLAARLIRRLIVRGFLQKLGGGGGSSCWTDLFSGCDGAFGHGVVGHSGVELAAGDEAEDGRDEAADRRERAARCTRQADE